MAGPIDDLKSEVRRRWRMLVAPGGPLLRAQDAAAAWLASIEPRERMMLGGAVFLVTGTIWYQSSFAPGGVAYDGARRSLDTVQREVDKLAAERDRLRELQLLAEDPDLRVREQIATEEAELARLNDRLVAAGLDFIAPAPMGEVLQAVEDALRDSDQARLVMLERAEGEGLLQAGSADSSAIVRRRIRLVFESDYTGTIAYLDALEALPFRFAWESFDYSVVEHPLARVEVRFSAFAPETLQ